VTAAFLAADPARDTLVTVWVLLLGVLLAGYAVLDGFDLGVGILHPFAPRTETERRLAVNAIGPLWDGNEVWLVTFGGATFAMFPVAYAALFSGFYTAFMLLLVALIFRAASIELRGKAHTPGGRRAWDRAFFAGSVSATFLFGVAAGNLTWGLPVDAAGTVTSGVLEQLHPFALLTGATTVAVFAVHGGAYLALKTDGDFQERIFRVTAWAFAAFAALLVVQTSWAILAVPRATANFLHTPGLWAVPAVNAVAVASVPWAILKRRAGAAFAATSFAIASYVFLLMAALYPDLVPATDPAHRISAADAASSDRTLVLGLIVVAIGMPFVTAYTGLVYWTFRGKVKLDSHSY
jgi:cytochrome d ubiquinol oxidase subunit II